MLLRRLPVVAGLVVQLLRISAFAQSSEPPADTVRVIVSINADGSRTTYQWDNANHKATATTTKAGKLREKIHYVLDDANRFASGEVFGPNNALRFTTRYKYDPAGRLAEESQIAKGGTVQNRIVYTYDSAGKQISYSVYDGAGKLISRTDAPKLSHPERSRGTP